MSHWHMQPWDGKDSLHLFCGSLALALLLDPALPRAAPPGGRLQAGLGPGLLWVRSGFSPLRGDAAQPPLHHPGRLAHTPAYLHMCTNHKYIAKFCRHIYQILSMIYTLSMQPRQPGLCHVTLAVCIVTAARYRYYITILLCTWVQCNKDFMRNKKLNIFIEVLNKY